MTRPAKNYRAAGIFIALTVVAAVAAEHYSVNRHGGVVEQPRYDMAITAQANPAKGVGASPTPAENSVAPAVPVNGASSTTVGAPSDDTQARPDARVNRRVAGTGETAKAEGVRASDTGIADPVAVPATCAATLIADPTQGVCGWYRATKGDVYRLRSPIYDKKTGKVTRLDSAKNGQYYFAYSQGITHVQPLDCIDPRVSNAVNVEGQHNVYCVAGGKLVRKAPADDASMTPMDLFVRHDLLRQYAATEEGR